MPFDNPLQQVVLDAPVWPAIDPLTVLGITPLDAKFVTDYKREYTTRNYGTWRNTTWSPKSRKTVDQFLGDPIPHISSIRDRSPPPANLRVMARQVVTEIEGASLTVAYTDHDPVLYVTYVSNGAKRKAALGIWEAGRLLHIAKRD
jgi:hypothetical protein